MEKLIKLTAKLLTFWIPISSVRRDLRNKIILIFENIKIQKIQKNYPKTLKKIKLKIQRGEKINVGFFVIYDSIFPAEPLFKKMLEDDLFNPFIVVIPDISRGEENMFYQMNKTYNTLSGRYKNVYKSYNKKNQNFIDYNLKCDLMCTANPYDKMTHKLYRIIHCACKNILTFYIPYCFNTTSYDTNIVANLDSLNCLWKRFCLTKENFVILQSIVRIKNNLVLSGYAKMDLLPLNTTIGNRKKIIIAPHHTVEDLNNSSFALSNFLKYAYLFLKLPEKYQQINWVFRPHPLLFITLKNKKLWTDEQIKNYLEKITSYSNVEYQEGGEYFKTFASSDALIYDSSSFILEYIYTHKPALFMAKKEYNFKFNKTTLQALKTNYFAYSEDEIYEFIDNVVIKGNDKKQDSRIKFWEENLKFNFPKVSESIIEHIKKELL